MKWMIASDIHGSAAYCEKLLAAFGREQAARHTGRRGRTRRASRRAVFTIVSRRRAPPGGGM